jgi:hypothetical protein
MTVKVAKANQEGEMQIDVKEIQKWEIQTKTYMGSTVLIKTKDDGTYSMYRQDFEKIFGR